MVEKRGEILGLARNNFFREELSRMEEDRRLDAIDLLLEGIPTICSICEMEDLAVRTVRLGSAKGIKDVHAAPGTVVTLGILFVWDAEDSYHPVTEYLSLGAFTAEGALDRAKSGVTGSAVSHAVRRMAEERDLGILGWEAVARVETLNDGRTA